MRPQAVKSAEGLYLASLVPMLILAVLGWGDAVAAIGAVAAFGMNAFFIGLSLLLLILTTRRASRVALWLLVAIVVLNLIGYLWQVWSGVLATGLFGVLTTAQTVLTLIAIVLLFRPRAQEWFARAAHVAEVEA